MLLPEKTTYLLAYKCNKLNIKVLWGEEDEFRKAIKGLQADNFTN